MDDREDLVYQAKLAEQAERYDGELGRQWGGWNYRTLCRRPQRPGAGDKMAALSPILAGECGL